MLSLHNNIIPSCLFSCGRAWLWGCGSSPVVLTTTESSWLCLYAIPRGFCNPKGGGGHRMRVAVKTNLDRIVASACTKRHYCTLTVPPCSDCSISYMANHPISSDIGRLNEQAIRVVCMICNKFLIEWVALQYHWTLDSSCLYLARPTDSSNIRYTYFRMHSCQYQEHIMM